MGEKAAKLNVELTENYRLTSDGSQYILQKRKDVDPTRAPGYKAPDDGTVPPMSVRWVDDGFYSYTHDGLVSLLNRVILAEAGSNNPTNLAEFLAAFSAERERITAAISGLLFT